MLPFVVKYRFSIEQRVTAAVAAATVHIMMMMSVSAMPAALWPTVTVRVFVRVDCTCRPSTVSHTNTGAE